jgi:hypothetical protein
MVATDVASRGIGMIDHNPSPLPTNMLSYLYFLPLTSCGHWCSSLLTMHTAWISCPGFVSSSSKENLGSEMQFAIGTFWVLCLLTSIKRSESASFRHFSKLQFQGFP